MGTNVSLSAFVAGTTISASAMNTHCTSINNAAAFFYNVGSIRGLFQVQSTVNVTTNFTNSLGSLPDFGFGCSRGGSHFLVCWNVNNSSSSIVQIVPDSGNGGAHWAAMFFNF